MNSPFKFPRRVRIHGEECGAVARALHHEVKGSSLYQADLEKSSRSTKERKQMSTKTTFKRIALATVAALGFGVLTSAPSNSVNTVSAAFTKSIAQSTTYLTVVGAGLTDSAGVISFTVTNESAATTQSLTAVGLVRDSETMTATVIAAPSSSDSVAQVSIRPVRIVESAVSGTTALRVTPNSEDSFAARTFALGGTTLISRYEAPDYTPATGQTTTGKAARYSFAFAANNAAALDKGYFTVLVRTQTADGRVIDNTVYVRFVSSIADAGASISVTGAGILRTGETLTYQTNKYYQASLTDPNGGRIQTGIDVNGTSTESVTVASLAPAMTARLVTSAGVLIAGTAFSVDDSGVAAVDHVAPTTESPSTAATGETAANAARRNISNGVYGITTSAALTQTLTDLATNKLQVRLTGSSAQGELAVTTAPANASSLTAVSTKLTVAGIAAADAAYTSTTASTTATKAYTLPLSAKSVTLSIDTVQASQNLTTTTTWSGNYASANVTPAVSATGAVLTTATDADGTITRTITNSTPLAGAVATVVITGFANADHSVTVTLTWAAPVVSSVTVVEPVSGIHVALKGTTNFVVSVKDQFGNGMAGEILQPVVGGSAAALGNYSATTTYATITTDASGLATWSFKDAAASNDGSDSITFRSISASSVVSDAFSITYKTTVAAVSSFLGFYSQDWNDQTATSVATTIPTTGITAANKLSLVYGLNLSDGLLRTEPDDSNTNALVGIRYRALTSAGLPAVGAAVTVTAGTGGHIVGLAGTPVSSRTFAVGTAGDVIFQVLATASGTINFTVTSGTATNSFSLDVAVPSSTSARNIAISGATTGTANGEGVPMTVTVKDRYGNPVTNVLLTVAASGVGSFAGGATTQSFTTDATGTYTFLATSLVSAGGAGSFSASIATAGSDATSSAGYVGDVEVDSTLAAGVASASASVTFAAGQNKAEAAAEAASDAAAEAIDAANAATDAANLAAEAADAATVAAEEARDAADAATAAVEELATQVATLMAALKAQITTLANTVAKIAKKVRA
jgi:hypothetical protein